MQAPLGPHEPAADHPVWKALSLYTIGPEDAALPFVVRLARENGWRPAHAERVLEEYRRFCFLAATCGHVVTPSDAVDQAWHLHLLYTESYWEDFCGRVLQRKFHHGPTRGGSEEGSKYHDWYEATLASYRRTFGVAPPVDIWPAAKVRFADADAFRPCHEPQRVNGDSHGVVERCRHSQAPEPMTLRRRAVGEHGDLTRRVVET